MEVKEALLKRRSVRKFKETVVPEEYIEELLHAAMAGPSACNKVPWEFYVVTDQTVLEKLKDASKYTGYDAPLAIIVCGTLSRALPMQLAEFWVQDCSAATENILLRATDLGLGTVWCGLYPQKTPAGKVKALLNLPEEHIPLNIIYIGYPDKEPEARDQYNGKYVHYI
ncbi:MAG: nitroreductase family protein [Erysipelotrichaceae bacterium]|nr:nitroreductase family protein [Erysipelotrichaceae bacterium]